ncbi:MAG: RNA polymerase sigma factor [Desulfobacterales bacterium]
MRDKQYDFTQILSDFQDAVYNQAYRMLGSTEEAEDAAQDIFFRIYDSLDQFRGESRISSWIYRITANVCIGRLRKRQRRASHLGPLTEYKEQMLPEPGSDQREDPEGEYAAKQVAEFVRSEVGNLPPLWAQAISLHYFGGETYLDIAEAMKIPKGTVATYISRGKKQLAKAIVARFGRDAICLR